ncbi:MAG: phosphatidylglycerophosphatase A [bacterium]|nr:phosphatidylglycerophosphatase A [bacterium]
MEETALEFCSPSTGFFSGYSLIAPGTAGTAVALVIYCLMPELTPVAWAVFLVGLFFVGVWAASAGEAVWGKDPGPVVIDEFVGFFVTVAFLPPSVALGIAAFFLFRILDIFKPPPARWAEGLPGGWGVVVDDVIAGLYGHLLLRAALLFWYG